MRPTAVFMLAVFLARSVGAVQQGQPLMVRQRTTTADSQSKPNEPREQTLYFTAHQIVTDDPERRSIVDLDARTVTEIDKGAKAYTVTSFDAVRSQLDALRERLGKMRPEVRKFMGFDTPMTVTPTGKSEKILGFDAKEYAATGGGSSWVTDQIEVPKETSQWSELMAGAPQWPGGQLMAEIAKLKGLPLRTTLPGSIGPNRSDTTIEVIEVRETVPPAELLSVPPGFQKVTAPRREQ